MQYYTVKFYEDSDTETVSEFGCAFTAYAEDPFAAISISKDCLFKEHPILANTFNWSITNVYCSYTYRYDVRFIASIEHGGLYTESQLEDLKVHNVCLISYAESPFYNRYRTYYNVTTRDFVNKK